MTFFAQRPPRTGSWRWSDSIIIRGVTASPQTDATVGVYRRNALTGLGSSSPGSGGNRAQNLDMERVEVPVVSAYMETAPSLAPLESYLMHQT